MKEMQHPVILFDGVCNFCNGIVNFLIRQDKKKVFRFAALQSEAGKKITQEHGIENADPDSFILIDKGKVYKYSTAGLKLYNKLSWYWKWTQIFWIFPAFLRDPVYRLIAKNRYKWFGKKATCMIPSPGIRDRFLN